MANFRHKKSGGFTVLEVLIATVIAGVSIFAIMEAFNRGFFGVGQVEDYSLALSLSQEKMEEIRGLSFNAVSSLARAQVSGFSNFEQEMIATSVHADLKEVVVRTFWSVPNGENNVSLTTYIVNN